MPQYTLPQLNTQGPDLVNTYLTGIALREKREDREERRTLAQIESERRQEEMGLKKEQFAQSKQQGNAQILFHAISSATSMPDDESANNTFKMFMGKFAPDMDTSGINIKSKGSDVELSIPTQGGGTLKIKGPKSAVRAGANVLAQNPQAEKDPEFQSKMLGLGVSVNVTNPKGPEKGKTRTIQQGTQEVTQEWTGTEWKEIGKGPKFKPTEEGEKLQDKKRTFVDPESKKVITEEYNFNPKTGKREVTNSYEYPVGTMIMGYDAEGNAILGTTKGPMQESKAPVGMSRPEAEKLRLQEVYVSNALSTVKQIQGLVQQNPSVIGAVGSAQRFVDSASEQLGALSKSLGGSSKVHGKLGDDSQLLNPENYNFKSFSSEAAKSAQIKSLFLKLAYLQARADDPGGRLSDYDVQLALDRIGGSTGSTAQMNAVLDMISKNLEFEFGQRYEITTGKKHSGFGVSKSDVSKLSDDEILKGLGQ